jgi:hypothetical protein
MTPSLKNNRMNQIRIRSVFFLILASLLVSGCATSAPRVKVVPAPARSFSPEQPGFLILPVVINFPPGGKVFQNVTNFFKDGIEQMAQNVVLKSKIKGLWKKMAVPIHLDKDLWLLIRPETISVGKIKGGTQIKSVTRTVLEISAKPEIFFGPEPKTISRPMPPLQPFVPGQPMFEAMSNVHVTYADTNRYLSDPRMRIHGRLVPNTGDRKLTLEKIRLYGSGGKVVVEVKIHYSPMIVNLSDKPAHLTLYLTGTPRYLPQEKAFDLPDLDYDIKSSDLMFQVADWILKSDFKDQLRRVAKFPIGKKMNLLKAKINKSLNRPFGRHTRLNTQVSSFDVLDAYADNEGIEILVSIKGTSTLEVNW